MNVKSTFLAKKKLIKKIFEFLILFNIYLNFD